MSRRRGGAAAQNTTSRFRDKERNYGLGRRNPTTLPSWGPGSESWNLNAVKSREWRQAGAWVASVAAVGAKYI